MKLTDEQKSELKVDINKFVTANLQSYEDDLNDIEAALNYAAGRDFSDDDSRNKLWDNSRPQVNVNLLKPHVNAIVKSYTDSPFALRTLRVGNSQVNVEDWQRMLDHVTVQSDLVDTVANCIAETAQVGQTYVYVSYHKTRDTYEIDVKRIDSRQVITDARKADCSDATKALIIEPIKRSKANEYGLDSTDLRRPKLFNNCITENLRLQDDETVSITFYEIVKNALIIYKIINDDIIDSEVYQGVTKIPIVRFFGEKIVISGRDCYRGLYYSVSDLCKTVNFCNSLAQERIALSPTTGWTAAIESVTGNEKQYADAHKKARGVMLYRAYDDNGKPLPKPEVVNKSVNISDVEGYLQTTILNVNAIIGSNLATPASNKTAEEVLTNREHSEASSNVYLLNAKKSLLSLGRVLLDTMGIVYVSQQTYNGNPLAVLQARESVDVEITKGPISATANERNLQKLLAFSTTVSQSPETAKIAPALVELIEADEATKNYLRQLYPMVTNTQPVIPPEVQLQIQAGLTENDQLKQQLAESNKQIAALQIQLNEFVDDSEIKLRIAQMDNETKIYLKRLELSASNEELQAKLQADFMQSQAKLAAELEKKRLELQKSMPMPETPIFNRGRFV